MARKPIPRDLPPPAEVFSSLSEFEKLNNKRIALIQELKNVAKRFRKRSSQPFYSMREIGDYFSVPLRTVALAFEALELEGILSRVRGSHTILTGYGNSLKQPVRGVVGIPVWLHALVVSPYSRTLHIELEERIRANGFVADLIFYRHEELGTHDFSNRLLKHNLDIVIWHAPQPRGRNTILALKDCGTRQVIIQATDSLINLPLPSYLMNWEPAYEAMMADWKRSGITRVVIPDPIYPPAKRYGQAFQYLLEKWGFHYEVVELSTRAIRDAIGNESQAKQSTLAFIDQLGADAICNEEPVFIEELIRISRVAFCRGLIRIPYFNHRPGKVDVCGFQAKEIAQRVADNLNKTQPPHQEIIHIFSGNFYKQVNLNEMIELL